MNHRLAFAYSDSSRYMLSETNKKLSESTAPRILPPYKAVVVINSNFFPLVPNNTGRIDVILIL